MKFVILAALVLLAVAPLASGGDERGLAQLERAIKGEVNDAPQGAVVTSVRCTAEAGLARCVVTSLSGTERTARAPVGSDVGQLVWEPLSG